jgi:hypothetical protein
VTIDDDAPSYDEICIAETFLNRFLNRAIKEMRAAGVRDRVIDRVLKDAAAGFEDRCLGEAIGRTWTDYFSGKADATTTNRLLHRLRQNDVEVWDRCSIDPTLPI